MDLSYILKLPAFAIMLASELVAFNPPNPGPAKDIAVRGKYRSADLMTAIVGTSIMVSKFIVYPLHAAECVAVLAREFPSPLSNRILAALFNDPSSVERLSIRPTFIAGVAMLAVGATIRKICYVKLGKFFTFELAVFKDHKLVTTGPYAIVRHPAYVGFHLAHTGLMLVLVLPGSYLWESGILETWWTALLMSLWLLVINAVHIATVRRMKGEEEVMRKKFGAEWEEWARRTPYKLIPYVY
ncbi:ICMT-domain-containing protein [Polyporus arcularius HHB13444]|uniref:Protein-S-isoprenylcysteine O-methyltransferase n=1 Tax=Polyporus arcularius HHB13444 TaxID=1314778 RepID=A0A5C3PIY0_9APHY|nr:ICMT-domain-containing protein [Polyporus arcularius HHB13444]